VVVLSGKPMDEPIVFDSGPLVLNIMDETQQAVNDYSAVQLVKAVSKKTPQQLNRRGS
tara:strand:- start:74904 stop:75077 length:174 start_codon:yes stop_codon:yes gene_type:complete